MSGASALELGCAPSRRRILAERARVGVERLLGVAELACAAARRCGAAATTRLRARPSRAASWISCTLDERRPLLGAARRSARGCRATSAGARRRAQAAARAPRARRRAPARCRGCRGTCRSRPSTSSRCCSRSWPRRYFSSTMRGRCRPAATSVSSRRITGDSSFHCCVAT